MKQERLDQLVKERYSALVVAILVLGCAARLGVALLFQDFDPKTANIWEYGVIARYYIEHGTMMFESLRPDGTLFTFPSAYMPPLENFLWIGLFSLFGITKTALAVMTLLNIAMGTGIVYFTMRIASALFQNRLVSLIAGVFMALQPVFVFSAGATYHALNLYIILLLAVFDLLVARPSVSWKGWALSGVLSGLAVLARTEYLVLTAAIQLGALINRRQIMGTVIAAVCALAVILPWTARNYIVLHHFIPVANSSGYNLYKGFNPEANGSGNWVDEHRVAEHYLGKQLAQVPLTPDFESANDKVYGDAAKAWMHDHPFESYVVLPVKKFVLFWLYDYTDGTTHEFLYQLQFWPLFLLTILGLALAARDGAFRRPEHRVVLILFLFEAAVMMYYAVHARYRMNVEPFLYAYAAYGLAAMLAYFTRTPALRTGSSNGAPLSE